MVHAVLVVEVVVLIVWERTPCDSISVLSLETESLIPGSVYGIEGNNGGLERSEKVEWRAKGEDFRALDRKTVSLQSSTMCNSNGTESECSGE